MKTGELVRKLVFQTVTTEESCGEGSRTLASGDGTKPRGSGRIMAADGPATSLRRKDSIGLSFSSEKISYNEVCSAIFDTLRVKYQVIAGIQFVKSNKVIVKFAEEAPFRGFLDRYEGQVVSLPASAGAGTVKVINFSQTVTHVSVINAPFEMEDDVIMNTLRRYGRVLSIKRNVHTRGPAQGIQTGVRTVKMEAKHKIPSSVTVSGYNLTFTCTGHSRRECHRCGCGDHSVHDCDVKPTGTASVFYDNEFQLARGLGEVETKGLSEVENMEKI